MRLTVPLQRAQDQGSKKLKGEGRKRDKVHVSRVLVVKGMNEGDTYRLGEGLTLVLAS